jgi:hypothetical protein
MRIFPSLVFLAFFPGLCGAADDGTSQDNPCDDPVVFSEPPSRVPKVVTLEHLATPTPDEPRLVWHCGTPDPPSPPVEARSAVAGGAVIPRASRAGSAVVPESGR